MTENDQQPFSEEAALRALEDLQREIEQSRVRRKDAAEAFDRFLRSFDRRSPVPPVAREEARITDDTLVAGPPPPPFQGQALTWPPPDLPSHPGDAIDPDAPTLLTLPGADTQEPLRLDPWAQHGEPSAATAAFYSESDMPSMTEATRPRPTPSVPAALRAPAPRSSRRVPAAVSLLVVLIAGAAVFFVWRTKSRDAEASTEPAAAAVTAPQPVAAAPPPAAPAPPPAAEVSTVRRVWVRVLVDGQKVLERELPPDARVPLTPTSQVVVRAGDAGAVRVAIAGKDQGPVGRNGEAATRQFNVAAPPGR